MPTMKQYKITEEKVNIFLRFQIQELFWGEILKAIRKDPPLRKLSDFLLCLGLVGLELGVLLPFVLDKKV